MQANRNMKLIEWHAAVKKTAIFQQGLSGLGGDRRCGFTGTVFGPGFFPVRVGRHLVFAICITSFCA